MNAWMAAVMGGVLVGLGSAVQLWATGKVAGISGIAAPLIGRWTADTRWRAAFVLGLFLTGTVLAQVRPDAFGEPTAPNDVVLVVAGLLVGFGSRLGGGCTSGHGVCGLGRGSPRSLAATVTFIGTGMLAVALTRLAVGS